MNKHIELVKKWLAGEDVTTEELRANSIAAVSRAHADAADAAWDAADAAYDAYQAELNAAAAAEYDAAADAYAALAYARANPAEPKKTKD